MYHKNSKLTLFAPLIKLIISKTVEGVEKSNVVQNLGLEEKDLSDYAEASYPGQSFKTTQTDSKLEEDYSDSLSTSESEDNNSSDSKDLSDYSETLYPGQSFKTTQTDSKLEEDYSDSLSIKESKDSNSGDSKDLSDYAERIYPRQSFKNTRTDSKSEEDYSDSLSTSESEDNDLSLSKADKESNTQGDVNNFNTFGKNTISRSKSQSENPNIKSPMNDLDKNPHTISALSKLSKPNLLVIPENYYLNNSYSSNVFNLDKTKDSANNATFLDQDEVSSESLLPADSTMQLKSE